MLQRICLKGITYCLFSVVNFYLFQEIANVLHTLKNELPQNPCFSLHYPYHYSIQSFQYPQVMVTSRIKADHIAIKKCINSIKNVFSSQIKENSTLSGKLDMIMFM